MQNALDLYLYGLIYFKIAKKKGQGKREKKMEEWGARAEVAKDEY